MQGCGWESEFCYKADQYCYKVCKVCFNSKRGDVADYSLDTRNWIWDRKENLSHCEKIHQYSTSMHSEGTGSVVTVSQLVRVQGCPAQPSPTGSLALLLLVMWRWEAWKEMPSLLAGGQYVFFWISQCPFLNFTDLARDGKAWIKPGELWGKTSYPPFFLNSQTKSFQIITVPCWEYMHLFNTGALSENKVEIQRS